VSNINRPFPYKQAQQLLKVLNNNIYRPNYAAGVELDGPYRPTRAHHIQRVRQALANTLARVQATVQKLSTKQGSRT
jgi:hypothetical protein